MFEDKIAKNLLEEKTCNSCHYDKLMEFYAGGVFPICEMTHETKIAVEACSWWKKNK
jgi:hypothetical protein